ncbi:hypothetical protein CRE_11124 [Caenorhabditis remanei]|uniref:Uncharacterized protein n=1 Tax=Caenorhabditis remanei TaxID=31234 RepID=E3M5P7_CAERE|nr:hypothetical protein CRE_11124 [Caenorhabditis remanei]
MKNNKAGNQVEADFARLGVRIELPDKRTFSIDQFELFVNEAIREIFGNCGPIVKTKLPRFTFSDLRIQQRPSSWFRRRSGQRNSTSLGGSFVER